jgi:hypothetical protein
MAKAAPKIKTIKQMLRDGKSWEEFVAFDPKITKSHLKDVAYGMSVKDDKVYKIPGIEITGCYVSKRGSSIIGRGSVEELGFSPGAKFKLGSGADKSIVLTYEGQMELPE